MHKFLLFLVTVALLAGLGVGAAISVTGQPAPAGGSGAVAERP
ncbi:hypothetical protein Arub01_53660 [Actinomadura rubrobrunea]|uniref:Uncharacterized protein n=1 Tax=Actinomadura rubrobrunea TaxID=115335 RepID=A0A9W6Q224_9ACTN|nr:hypothetical protein [Actinomadura rubrobrunea]GLW67123.1 hypothetical protein Arub01_53660 [Actinomadura rubrobrunea]